MNQPLNELLNLVLPIMNLRFVIFALPGYAGSAGYNTFAFSSRVYSNISFGVQPNTLHKAFSVSRGICFTSPLAILLMACRLIPTASAISASETLRFSLISRSAINRLSWITTVIAPLSLLVSISILLAHVNNFIISYEFTNHCHELLDIDK